MDMFYKTKKEDFPELEELSKFLGLTEEELADIRVISQTYKMRVSRYYTDLIQRGDTECPMRRQCIPTERELEAGSNFEEDPLAEERYSPVPFLVHKYQDRVAFMASSSCFLYCRHCTRKNTAINGRPPNEEEFDAILDYIKRTPGIRDVLITGGDPLTLSDEMLEHYISAFREIPHVETIRIGTRAVVTYPARITEKLADMLEKYHPVWLNTQFNHPDELTKEAKKACDILLSRGIPLGNQSVLMRGINDHIDTMEKLVTGLIRMRVRPYYLYQLDNVKGTEQFYVPYTEGMALIEELRRRVSGYALPRFILDAPGEHGGKVVVEENHILETGKDYVMLSGREAGTTAVYQFGEKKQEERP